MKILTEKELMEWVDINAPTEDFYAAPIREKLHELFKGVMLVPADALIMTKKNADLLLDELDDYQDYRPLGGDGKSILEIFNEITSR